MYLVLCLLRRWWARFFFWVMFIVFLSCSLRTWLGKNLFIADLCFLHTGRVIFGNSTVSLPVAGHAVSLFPPVIILRSVFAGFC